ncbi:hypothetical protein AB0I91_31265 [Actinosynnema sp. NPDC049800]
MPLAPATRFGFNAAALADKARANTHPGIRGTGIRDDPVVPPGVSRAPDGPVAPRSPAATVAQDSSMEVVGPARGQGH